ncbi:MAG: hypothetical protein IH989_01345 [Planctomycetes bacterium]|nr:hypothetical protein [Planctomycetota bacterium]
MFAQLAAWDWSQLFKMPTLAYVACGITAIFAIALPHWRRVREVEASSRLKQKMIDRGYSAEEIERVLKAGRDEEASERS